MKFALWCGALACALAALWLYVTERPGVMACAVAGALCAVAFETKRWTER